MKKYALVIFVGIFSVKQFKCYKCKEPAYTFLGGEIMVCYYCKQPICLDHARGLLAVDATCTFCTNLIGN